MDDAAELDQRPIRPDVSARDVLAALAIAALFVVATRWPVARTEPFESDEFILVDLVGKVWFNIYHTLFITAGRLMGLLAGDRYIGFVWLDMLTSVLALVAVWWWLRALVRPGVAAAGALLLAVAPVFWGYGAMAGSYTMVVAVGSFLLGVAVRTWAEPKAWHPYAAAAVLAIGTGYRHDTGMLWLPVLFVILARHRWVRAGKALALFTALNLTWIGLMLYDAGGWSRYREATREFAYNAGYLNSAWNLGVVDASVRYGVKLAMALIWTFGPALVLVPLGIRRLASVESPRGRWVLALLILSMLPALGLHLLVHFGVQGYAFHYVPALVGLIALGSGGLSGFSFERAPARLAGLAACLAAVFLFYPTNYNRPGVRGDLDIAFARHTRVGLRTRLPHESPVAWRTANSKPVEGR